MNASLLIVAAALAIGQPGPDAPSSSDIIVENARVTFMHKGEAQVAAQEAGVLMGVAAEVGMEISTGDLLAQIDDRPVVAQRAVAEAERAAAQSEADNDVNIRYAEANFLVASKAYEMSNAANKRVASAITAIEMQKLALEKTSAKLQIEQSQLKRDVTQHTANARAADVAAADVMIARRKITSPIDGIVVEVNRNPGEWVNPGDVVAHVIRMDKLRIEGRVKLDQAALHEIRGRPITATISLSRGQSGAFKGQISFAQPQVIGGEYLVQAVVENRKVDGEWLLLEGQAVSQMTIHLGPPAQRAANEARPLLKPR